MNRYIFISILIAGGLIVYGGYASRCSGAECDIKNTDNQINTKMNLEQIKKQVESNEVFLLDVREVNEWDLGHIAGAKLISLGNINAETTKDLPKDMPIYVYCRSGSRAGQAVTALKQLGFSNAINIGGIIHWQEEGGELVQ
ncbi:MAG: phage shock protein [Patescibacteria group bacterium]|jgi:rhodanese-related sulfurtransferase|nr:phage shock protein [Patescibacteria group bacterium]